MKRNFEKEWVRCDERKPVITDDYLVTVPVTYCKTAKEMAVCLAMYLKSQDRWIIKGRQGTAVEYGMPVA